MQNTYPFQSVIITDLSESRCKWIGKLGQFAQFPAHRAAPFLSHAGQRDDIAVFWVAVTATARPFMLVLSLVPRSLFVTT
ncbi:MAG: hypothetical protein JWR15_417 [Prosthecobacter sp.]|nr:hypothetical protein [Prosthecobacter sp.]